MEKLRRYAPTKGEKKGEERGEQQQEQLHSDEAFKIVTLMRPATGMSRFATVMVAAAELLKTKENC